MTGRRGVRVIVTLPIHVEICSCARPTKTAFVPFLTCVVPLAELYSTRSFLREGVQSCTGESYLWAGGCVGG